jgi:hypothetical protein
MTAQTVSYTAQLGESAQRDLRAYAEYMAGGTGTRGILGDLLTEAVETFLVLKEITRPAKMERALNSEYADGDGDWGSRMEARKDQMRIRQRISKAATRAESSRRPVDLVSDGQNFRRHRLRPWDRKYADKEDDQPERRESHSDFLSVADDQTKFSPSINEFAFQDLRTLVQYEHDGKIRGTLTEETNRAVDLYFAIEYLRAPYEMQEVAEMSTRIQDAESFLRRMEARIDEHKQIILEAYNLVGAPVPTNSPDRIVPTKISEESTTDDGQRSSASEDGVPEKKEIEFESD